MQNPSSAAVDVEIQLVSSGAEAVSFPDRLDIIRELMLTLDLVTRSGQGHVMERLLSILRRELVHAEPLAEPQLVVVTTALAQLGHEAGRISPVPAVFNDHVRRVVDILSNAWKERTGR